MTKSNKFSVSCNMNMILVPAYGFGLSSNGNSVSLWSSAFLVGCNFVVLLGGNDFSLNGISASTRGWEQSYLTGTFAVSLGGRERVSAGGKIGVVVDPF